MTAGIDPRRLPAERLVSLATYLAYRGGPPPAVPAEVRTEITEALTRLDGPTTVDAHVVAVTSTGVPVPTWWRGKRSASRSGRRLMAQLSTVKGGR